MAGLGVVGGLCLLGPDDFWRRVNGYGVWVEFRRDNRARSMELRDCFGA